VHALVGERLCDREAVLVNVVAGDQAVFDGILGVDEPRFSGLCKDSNERKWSATSARFERGRIQGTATGL
jgi:hypothetical protein